MIRGRIVSCSEELFEATGLRKNGATFPVEVCGKEIPYAGGTARVVILRDITWRKLAEEQLRNSAQQLQALSRRLLEVQEQERRYLARELHDQIGQVLTGLNFTLQTTSRLPEGQVKASLGEAQALVKELTAQVRELSLHLRPTMLDDLGLVPALLWHLERYTAQTGIHVDFQHSGLDRRLPTEVETAAYRIVQEALTNVARHAGVQEAEVRTWLEQEVLHLQIEDQGGGFDQASVAAGTTGGLSSMRERAVLLGGRLEIDSRLGAGTRVQAEVPVGDTKDAGD